MSDRARYRLPPLAYNGTSFLGATIALLSAITFLVLLGMSLMSHQQNPYFGIFMYMVLPPVLLLGLLLIPVGMLLRRRRVRRTGEAAVARWPHFDLNDHRHRNAAIVFVLGTLVFAIIMSVGSYGAYHYSESVAFCGTTCHDVMEPEYVTYQSSPHARVACTSCHVGPGADWYVKSKLSGAYQIYATVAEKYPTPIPTPIESLRPAQETCEQCHWPEKIYGAQQRQRNHFRYDDENTHWPINLLIKTGGGDPASGQSGIHWHMNIGVEVDYIARDEKRQDIPWMRVTDRTTGRVTIYQDTESPLTEEEIVAAAPRRMDCMDCHNRPSHIYRSPDQAIDDALLTGAIDRRIPGIKAAAVEAMAGEYETKDAAMRQIAGSITDRYRLERPADYETHRAAIDTAIEAVQRAYAGNVFPLMRASWSDYPNNLGHFQDRGCMRCHDGLHASTDGVVITKDCNACHLILAQGPEGGGELISAGLPFQHPEDLGGMELEVGCYECHSGVQP